MTEQLQIVLIFSTYGGLISYDVTGIIIAKIKDVKEKKRFRDNKRKIKDGTFRGSPYYSGISTLEPDPLSLSSLSKKKL